MVVLLLALGAWFALSVTVGLVLAALIRANRPQRLPQVEAAPKWREAA